MFIGKGRESFEEFIDGIPGDDRLHPLRNIRLAKLVQDIRDIVQPPCHDREQFVHFFHAVLGKCSCLFGPPPVQLGNIHEPLRIGPDRGQHPFSIGRCHDPAMPGQDRRDTAVVEQGQHMTKGTDERFLVPSDQPGNTRICGKEDIANEEQFSHPKTDAVGTVAGSMVDLEGRAVSEFQPTVRKFPCSTRSSIGDRNGCPIGISRLDRDVPPGVPRTGEEFKTDPHRGECPAEDVSLRQFRIAAFKGPAAPFLDSKDRRFRRGKDRA
ncbi:MAG: hypothetical protein A4E33_00785 [Methanoregula sp. PtaB.Bin085]|nr:MAG: hypothetical protein A4E33_00785 [Methanoregula sp. PtaB.Bin085]